MGDSHTMCDSHIGDIKFLVCLACEIGLTSVSIKPVVGQSIALHAVPAYTGLLPTQFLPSRLIQLHFFPICSILNGGVRSESEVSLVVGIYYVWA